MYQALYRKWRPRLFDDVVGQGHITRTLKRQVMSGHLSHAYLFTGTRGTGKTTCAKLLARAVNCLQPVEGNPCGQCAACKGIEDGSILDVVELDAASNNGVDQVRALREEAVYAPAAVKRRVYIVDEVHMLSTGAFNALLKILEEPPEHVMFILATTELHKVPATILSRCQRFSFKRIQAADIQNRLLYIAQAEGIALSEDAAALLARLGDGAMRDALSLLDQCAVSGGAVDRNTVLDALGLAGNTRTAHLMNHIRRGDTAKALTELSDLYAAGKDVGTVLSELSDLARDLLLRHTAGSAAHGLLAGGYDEQTLSQLGKGFSPQRLLHMLRLLQDAMAKLKGSANRRTDAELCIIRLCDQTLDGSALGLSQRLSRLEAALANGYRVPAGENTPPFVPPPLPEADLPAEEAPQNLTADEIPAPTPSTDPPTAADPAAEAAEPAPTAGESVELSDTTAHQVSVPAATEDSAPPVVTEAALTASPDQARQTNSETGIAAQNPAEANSPAPGPLSEAPDLPPLPEEAPPEDSYSSLDGLLELDPPPEPEELPPSLPPEPQKPASTAPHRRQKGKKSPEKPGDPRFWQQLEPTLRETMDRVARGMLGQGLVMGQYADGVLRLYVPDPATRGWLSKEPQRTQIEQAAAYQAGRAVRVEVSEGQPPQLAASAQAHAPAVSSDAVPEPAVRFPAETSSSPASSPLPMESSAAPPEGFDPFTELLAFADSEEGRGIIEVE